MATPDNKYDKYLDDIRERDVIDLSSAPVSKSDAYIGLVDDVLYYFSNGHRYKLTATLDDPVVTTSGPWLSLGVSNF